MKHSERRAAFLCGLAILLCIASAYPVAEVGIWDDWSYFLTARHLAQTGHVLYNGWSTAMLGLQLYLGAAFIRLLGPSFIAVRATTMLMAVLSGPLMYATLRRCGVRQGDATIGTLTLALSPLYLSLSAIYMSDVPAYVMLLLFFYLVIRSLQATDEPATLRWLVAAAIVGLLAGSIRQIAWLSVLVALPSVVWFQRKRKAVLAWGLAVWVLSCIVVYLCNNWFHHQPFISAEILMPVPLRVAQIHRIILPAIRNTFVLMMVLLLPLTAGIALRSAATDRRDRTKLLAVLIGSALYVLLFATIYGSTAWSGFIPGVIGRASWFWEMYNYGNTPPYFSGVEQSFIAFVIIVCSIACLLNLLARRERSGEKHLWNESDASLLWLFVPFCACYLALIFTRAYVYDRYILIVLFVVILGLLRYHAQYDGRPVSKLAYLPLMLWAVVGVAQTHDMFAEARAKIALIQEMVSSGVPRTDIYTGFASDGMVEIEHSGYVNEQRIQPAHLYRKAPAPSQHPCSYWFASYLPSMRGHFVLSNRANLCYPTSKFPPMSYESWFRPRHRTIYAIEVPEQKWQHYDTK